MAKDEEEKIEEEEPKVNLDDIAADAVIESVPAEVHERILATDENAEKIAGRLEFKGYNVLGKGDKKALIKDVLDTIDAYERSYDAKKLEPAITAKALTGVRESLQVPVNEMREAHCDTAEPDEALIAKIKAMIGEEDWSEKVGGPIYNRGAFDGYMLAFATFQHHKDKTFRDLDTAGK